MGNLAEFYGRIQDIGSTDRINIQLGVRERLPKITLLSCVGHVLNNIAKQTLKDNENKPIFRLKRSFCNAFYSGAQTSAKQGKYRALGVQLAKFEKRVVDAEIFFMQSYGALGMEDAPNSWILILESRIREALYVLKPVVGESADLLLSELNNPDNTKEKHEILIKHGAQISEALNISRANRAVETPKLGGVTRWVLDKFVSISFLVKEMRTVMEYLHRELENERVSKSVAECARLIRVHGHEELQEEGKLFLSECKELHTALRRFSDSKRVPTATRVFPMFERLRETAASPNAPSGLSDAIERNWSRLERNHDMKIWQDVM